MELQVKNGREIKRSLGESESLDIVKGVIEGEIDI